MAIQAYEPIYTVEETAEVLKTGTAFVYEQIRQKRIRALKLGNIKIRGTDLEAYIEAQPCIEKEVEG